MYKVLLIAAALACAGEGCSRAQSGAATQPAPSPTLPITAGDYPAYGHAIDFTWVAGRLLRSAPAGGCTYVVFSTRSGAPWGGRIALYETADRSSRFASGDMVVVTGMLEQIPAFSCGSPGLRVASIKEH